MRIRRLDLIRYGRFTDEVIELPQASTDLHIVAGPNEAGKSTVRSALGDLLFGFPVRTALNFLHDYGSMRLGATVQGNGQRIEFRRRKGRRHTVLRPDDSRMPEGEAALARLLGTVDRAFFERMFSLDQERLRRGGQEILEGGSDDAGQKLFSAGSGIQNLQKRLAALDGEAKQLWSKRRSATKAYYIAHDKLKQAEALKRQHTVSAKQWKDARRSLQRANEQYERIQRQMRDLQVRLKRVSRIRRIVKSVADLERLDGELVDLGPVRDIRGSAGEELAEAASQRRESGLRIEENRRSLEDAKDRRQKIEWDPSLLARREDIEALHNERITVEKERRDLPRLQERLRREREALRSGAARIGWSHADADSIAERLPGREQIDQARSLLGQFRERMSEAALCQRSLREAETTLSEITAALTGRRETRDVTALRCMLADTKRSRGALGARIDAAGVKVAEAKAEVDRVFRGLYPRTEAVEDLVSLNAPVQARLQRYRDRWAQIERDWRARDADLAAKRRDLARLERRRQRIISKERPVRREDLAKARKARDGLWAMVRRCMLGGEGGMAEGQPSTLGPRELAASYEAAVVSADDLCDRRFATASAVAKVAEEERSIQGIEEQVREIREECGGLSEARSRLLDESQAAWADAPFKPGDPPQMLEWAAQYRDLRAAVLRWEKATARQAELRKQERESARALIAELEVVGAPADNLTGRPLGEALEHAEQVLRNHDRSVETTRRLQADLRKAASNVNAKRQLADAAKRAETQALQRWRECARRLGIDPSARAANAAARIGQIDGLRDTKHRMAQLEHDRIDKIHRDIRRFAARVAEVAKAVQARGHSKEADETCRNLEQMLGSAQQGKKDADKADRTIRRLERRMRDLLSERRRAQARITKLQGDAGVGTLSELRREIQRSDQHRELTKARSRAIAAVRDGGDGLSIGELRAECATVVVDELEPREQELREQVDPLQDEYRRVWASKTEAQKAFDAIGGSDAAAAAEAARQSALAEIEEIAERYVQVRSATCLLRWAIERYRTEKQGPMLQRAGELFSELTLGSFDHLELDFDNQDRACLVGRRESGKRVPMHGMSDGSADQLYLALRITALEDYLENAQPMPFVADDLFVNFDDERSAAAFKVLSGLAKHCQVIFFTHHDHLAELALQATSGTAQISRIGR